MPQLDKFTYFTQFFWSCLFFFTFYIAICNDGDGVLGISRILKLRNQLLSHRETNIRSNDPKSLEEILRKGFSTGVSYMYSSLFEVSQWCNAVDLLGKRKKITLISCFGELSGSRGMERNIFYFHLHFFFFQIFLGTNRIYSFFSSLPFVKSMPRHVQIFLFCILKYISFLVLSKIALAFGYIFMDDLERAVSQFIPSTSWGQPGVPSGGSGSGGTALPVPTEDDSLQPNRNRPLPYMYDLHDEDFQYVNRVSEDCERVEKQIREGVRLELKRRDIIIPYERDVDSAVEIFLTNQKADIDSRLKRFTFLRGQLGRGGINDPFHEILLELINLGNTHIPDPYDT
uniref:H(+)-transporting two-sector ATPase n=1 Tax=Clerodendrum yunnanense TaxID=201513 RepID=A0A6M8E1J4_9LAMI|nr:ATPase subunit 8 [Clerodendrum yunnanense]